MLNLNAGPQLGIKNATPATEAPKKADEPAEKEKALPTGEDGLVRWTAHPILRYSMGRFAFTNGLLTLSVNEAKEFEALLAQQPVSEQVKVRLVDVEAAERLVRSMMANSGGVTQAIDSSTGDRAKQSEVGKGVLGDNA